LNYKQEVTPPKISLFVPANETFKQSNVTITFSIDRPFNWLSYSLDGNQNVTVTGNFTIANLTNGLHNLTIYANSTFGYMGNQTINFTVDKTQMLASALMVVVIAVPVVIVCFIGGILLYRRHRKTLT
jgi:hypothetical protein